MAMQAAFLAGFSQLAAQPSRDCAVAVAPTRVAVAAVGSAKVGARVGLKAGIAAPAPAAGRGVRCRASLIEPDGGRLVDLVAPGEKIRAPVVDDEDAIYKELDGTSMAAPHVSGAAALFLEANPNATPDDVAQYLRESSTKNVVRDSRSPFSRMLFVGPREVRSLADNRRSAGQ